MTNLTEKEHQQLKGKIEAVLFASGDPVELKDLCRALSQDQQTLQEVLVSLMEDYEQDGRGLRLVHLGTSWQLSTRPEYYEDIAAVLNRQERNGLSRAALETLSIIAYRQPVTRVDIDQIRGVSSSSSVQRLLDRGLIREAGRLDAPGRPILYQTTEAFLKTVGLENLEALPDFETFASGEQQRLKINRLEEKEE